MFNFSPRDTYHSRSVETYLRHTINGAADGKNTLMHSRDNLADARFDAGLVAQLGDVLPALPNDDACVLGTNERPEGQIIGARRGN